MNCDTDYYRWWNPTQTRPEKKVFKSEQARQEARQKANKQTEAEILKYGTETEIEEITKDCID